MLKLNDMIRLNLILIFFITGLYSCNNSNKKLEELQQENKKLHTEILSLKKQIADFKFIPSVYAKSSRIKLGERYEAIIGTGVYSETKKSIVGIINRENLEKVDTLIYKPEDFGCKYVTTPNKKGHYIKGAYVTLPTIMDTIKTVIRWEFDVE